MYSTLIGTLSKLLTTLYTWWSRQLFYFSHVRYEKNWTSISNNNYCVRFYSEFYSDKFCALVVTIKAL